ncbi:MAG: glycosyltransferase family 4 protein, partial [Stackebrandtia sp.]
MLLNAYAMGGTVRTVFNQANALALAGHRVDIISVLRHRRDPRFPLAPSVQLTALVDDFPVGRIRGAARRWRRPGIEVPDREVRKVRFTRFVERRTVAALRQLRTEVLVTTRPALNLLAARHAPDTVVTVGQEHQHLGRHRGDLADAIRADYPRLDALVTL